jgi:hydrogenase maturation protease
MSNSHDGVSNEFLGTIKIIGLGQSLRGDDAAGLAAVRLWQERYCENNKQSNVQVELAELPGIGLLSLLEGAGMAILVDAVRSGADAGTIHILSKEHLDAFPNESGSAHGWGVAETLSLGEKVMPSTMPEKIIVIGIEGVDFSMGNPLSPGVELALPEVARLIEQLATQ